VSDLIVAHRFEYHPASSVIRRKPSQVLIEMAFNLALGFDDKTEARAIAEQGRQRADRERACIPERVQQARPRVELFQTGLAPGEVIGFFVRRLQEEIAGCCTACH